MGEPMSRCRSTPRCHSHRCRHLACCRHLRRRGRERRAPHRCAHCAHSSPSRSSSPWHHPQRHRTSSRRRNCTPLRPRGSAVRRRLYYGGAELVMVDVRLAHGGARHARRAVLDDLVLDHPVVFGRFTEEAGVVLLGI